MKGRRVRKGIMSVLAVALLVSGGYAIKTAQDFQQEAEIYQEVQQSFVTILPQEVPLVQVPDVVETEEVIEEVKEEIIEEPIEILLEPDVSVNFNGLQEVNSDIVAWIHIPNSTISYPILQGADNQQYLDTTYNGGYSVIGSIFMDYRINSDFTALNTIIYGHNVSSGTMFGALKAYKDATYVAEHPYFFLLTAEGYLRYEVCYVVVTTATSYVYDFQFTEDNSFAQHVQALAQDSLYATPVAVTEEDTIVTLSTCTGVTQEERLVVIGRLDAVES